MALFRKKIKVKKEPEAKAEVKPEAKSMKDLYSGATSKQSAAAKADPGGKAAAKAGNAHKILLKPLVTEKVSHLGALNKYVFAVAKTANKIEVEKAIHQIYAVWPAAVNIINVGGKKTRYGRTLGKRKDWKKAIITLKPGQTIKIYEGV